MSADKSDRIVVISAMGLEVKPLLIGLHKKSIDGFLVYDGIYEEHPLTVIVSGVGYENARRAAEVALNLKPKALWSLGFAGGLSPKLSSGALFRPTVIKNGKGNQIRCAEFRSSAANGTLITVPSIVETSQEKEALSVLADAVDMESYAKAETASKHGVPFFSLRIISDSVLESIPIDFSPALKNGKLNPLKAIFLILKQPASIPAIFSLGVRSNRYAKSLCNAFRVILADA